MPKYQIGDIITNNQFHYLIEDIKQVPSYDLKLCKPTDVINYSIRVLENNDILNIHPGRIDSNQYIWKVA